MSKDFDKRLADALGLNKNMKQNINTLISQLINQIKLNPAYAGLSDSVYNDILKNTKEMVDRYCDEVVQIHKDLFTQEELQDIVDYYESPTKQKIISLHSSILQKETEVLRDLQNEIMERVNKCTEQNKQQDLLPNAKIPIDMTKN
jgi:hypothetical protein